MKRKTTNARKNRKEVDVVAVKHVSQSTRLDQLRLQGTIQKHFRYVADLAKGSLSQQEVECIEIVWSEDIPERAGSSNDVVWRAGRGDEAEELQCLSPQS